MKWYNIFNVVVTTILLFYLFAKVFFNTDNKKTIMTIVSLFIYFVFGVSVMLVLCNGSLNLISCLLYLFFGFLISVFFYTIIDYEKKIYDTEYEPDKLIGLNGVIKSYYNEDGYLCELEDGKKTEIIIKFDEDVFIGSRFTITNIEGFDIKGKII